MENIWKHQCNARTLLDTNSDFCILLRDICSAAQRPKYVSQGRMWLLYYILQHLYSLSPSCHPASFLNSFTCSPDTSPCPRYLRTGASLNSPSFESCCIRPISPRWCHVQNLQTSCRNVQDLDLQHNILCKGKLSQRWWCMCEATWCDTSTLLDSERQHHLSFYWQFIHALCISCIIFKTY